MSMDCDGLCWTMLDYETVMHSHSGFRPWYRMPSAWSISASVMTSGGAKRIMFPCVGFASSPRESSVQYAVRSEQWGTSELGWRKAGWRVG
jgi:hypothetical protein